ncbi:MAG: DNA-binding domain-containing protein [Rhodoferax sp.]
MTAVFTLQDQFQSALLQDLPARAGLLKPFGESQFDVYRNAYRARLRGALRANYEVLPLVMGDYDFDAVANAYIDAKPSAHYSLRWFGHELCDFMASHDDLVAHPAMLDLARMEWALRTAFDAASVEPLTADALTSMAPDAWPNLRFGLHPAVQLLAMQWAVGPVWHALKAQQDDVPLPEALAHHMLVWRLGLNTQWKSLSSAEVSFVQSLHAGHTFAEICEALADVVGEDTAAQTAATQLREYLGNGVIASVLAPQLNSH